MFWGMVALAGGVFILLRAESGRRNSKVLQDDFMFRNGYTRSFVAMYYFSGKPDEARAAIISDARIRRKYLIEQYLWGAGAFLTSLWLFWNN